MGEKVDKIENEILIIKESINLIIRALNDNDLYIKSSIPELEGELPEIPKEQEDE